MPFNNFSIIFPREWTALYLVMLVSLIGILTLGAAAPLEEAQANRILGEVRRIVPERATADQIFLNNIRAGLIMTVPLLGLAQGVVIIYSTGLVFAATGVSLGVYGPVLVAAVALTPFFWLEFLAYSAGLTQGISIVRGLFRRRLRLEILRTVIVLAAIAGLLLLGALIEAWFLR